MANTGTTYGIGSNLVPRELISIKYRIDGDIDFHDAANPSTTACPFLPGQVVNVLDVPALPLPTDDLSRRALDRMESAMYTMNPRDKYLKPRPVIHREGSSPLSCPTALAAATGKDRKKPFGAPYGNSPLPAPTASKANAHSNSWKFWKRRPEACTPPAKSSIFAKFQRVRGAQSEALTGSQSSRRRVKTSKEESTVPSKSFYVPSHKAASTNDLSRMDGSMLQRPGFKRGPGQGTLAQSWSNSSLLEVDGLSKEGSRRQFQGSHDAPVTLEDLRREILAEASVSNETRPLEPPRVPNSFADEGCVEVQSRSPTGTVASANSILGAPRISSLPQDHPEPLDNVASPEDLDKGQCLHHDELRRKQSPTDSISLSYRTSENFSPGLVPISNTTDVMSHHRLSQPETPSTSANGGDFVDALTSLKSQMHGIQVRDDEEVIPDMQEMENNPAATLYDAAYHGFSGYNLPQPDQESTRTLKRLPSNPFMDSRTKHDQVHSWNDGSEDRMTALETLVNELGYLGELIN